jgi:hypothetical protein
MHLKDIGFRKPPVTIMELKQESEKARRDMREEMCRKACRSIVQHFRD